MESAAEAEVKPIKDLNEKMELEELLDNALGDFETQNSSTQTVGDNTVTSKSTGTDEKITKFGNNQLHSGSTTSKKVKFDLNSTTENSAGNNLNISNNNNVTFNFEYVDKLLDEFQQKINNIMANTATEPLVDSIENDKNNKSLTEEIQKKFCKMAQDTMTMLINQGLVNQDGTYTNTTNDNKNRGTDFKSVIAQAIKNLCQNSEELEVGILMNSSDEIANLINDLTFKDADQIDENLIEGHFVKIFIKIGQMLLYPPLKEICDKYPTYLKNNKMKLSKESFENYEKQYSNMVEICKIFEEDEAGSGPHDFPNMLAIMQEIQNCGLPPEELVQGNPFKMYDDVVAGFCYQNMNNLKNSQCSIL